MGLVEWPSFTYCTKFATVSGAFCSSSSRVMVPMLVWSLTMLFPLLDGFLRRLGGFGLDHARAGDRADGVAQAVIGLVADRGARRLVLQVRRESAALDHEARDHAMEHRAVVEPALHVFLEVLDRLGRPVRVQLQHDGAHAGLEFDLGGGGEGKRCGDECKAGDECSEHGLSHKSSRRSAGAAGRGKR